MIRSIKIRFNEIQELCKVFLDVRWLGFQMDQYHLAWICLSPRRERQQLLAEHDNHIQVESVHRGRSRSIGFVDVYTAQFNSEFPHFGSVTIKVNQQISLKTSPAGVAAWYIDNERIRKDPLEDFEKSLNFVLPLLKQLTHSSKVLWLNQFPVAERLNELFCLKCHQPTIERYNIAAREILRSVQ